MAGKIMFAYRHVQRRIVIEAALIWIDPKRQEHLDNSEPRPAFQENLAGTGCTTMLRSTVEIRCDQPG